MEPYYIRHKFIEKFGSDKYVEFVLSLYEAFPLRNKLFFWQEKYLEELSNDLTINQIDLEETYLIFNHCPIHDIELKKDIVPIFNGNGFKSDIFTFEEKKLFPLANPYALRDRDRFKYTENIEILYCPSCRQIRSEIEKMK